MNEDFFWNICEEELLKSNCCLIHFGSCLVKDGVVIGRGHNYALNPECATYCIKNKIKNLEVGKNSALCYAIHSEWMTLIDALRNKPNMVKGSTLYIIGRRPDGSLWKSNFFACTICSRLLNYCGVKDLKEKKHGGIWHITIKEALKSSIDHILEK